MSAANLHLALFIFHFETSTTYNNDFMDIQNKNAMNVFLVKTLVAFDLNSVSAKMPIEHF